jgi:hypothetical protein
MTIQRDLYIQRTGLTEATEEITFEDFSLEELEALHALLEEKEHLLEFEPVSMAIGAAATGAGILGFRKMKKMVAHQKAKSVLKAKHKQELQTLKKRYSGW